MSLEILEVVTKADLKRWVGFPLQHYADQPAYVPQILSEELSYVNPNKNPAFEVCDVCFLLAVDGDRIVGRICAIINTLETEKLGRRRGRFGWFETIDDAEVATGLLDRAREWLKRRGCVEMTGPHCFGDLDQEGLLIDSFDEIPTIAGCYNHPYYQRLVEDYGFIKDTDYLETRFEVGESSPFLDRLSRRNNEETGHRVVTCPSRKALKARIGEVWPVLEAAFAPLYGVMPLTPKQTDYYTKKYFGLLDPDFVKLIYSAEGTLDAFLVGMPNLSNAFRRARGKLLPTGFWHILKAMRKPETVDFLLAGAVPGTAHGLLTAIGVADMMHTLRRRGVRYVESNRQLEDNKTIHRLWTRFKVVNRRRSRVYRLPLDVAAAGNQTEMNPIGSVASTVTIRPASRG